MDNNQPRCGCGALATVVCDGLACRDCAAGMYAEYKAEKEAR